MTFGGKSSKNQFHTFVAKTTFISDINGGFCNIVDVVRARLHSTLYIEVGSDSIEL